ncbi:hypothetical protein CAL7716_058670 [Calothrix sp. PCC 7716]|nr:hypothetical protein CAL7716_058670 [Calothrix sp. PCC 7716]
MENQTETDIITTLSSHKVNGAELTSAKGAEYIVISANDKVDGAKHVSDEETESIAEETVEAIARNKSLIFGALIFLLGIISLWIVAKSSCGASFSLKLVPPELQLNSSSCDTQVEQSRKPKVFESQDMSSNK